MRIEAINPQTQNETFVLYSEYEDRGMPKKYFWKWNGSNWTTTRIDFLINFMNEYYELVDFDKRSEWLFMNDEDLIIYEMYRCHLNREKLSDCMANLIGYYKKNKKYYIYSDYSTTYSYSISKPTLRNPLNLHNHVKTHKYLKMFFEEFPAKLRQAKLLELNVDFMKEISGIHLKNEILEDKAA